MRLFPGKKTAHLSIAGPRNKGFTLVEIALAVGIFAFAIVAIMALFPVGLRSASESRNETISAQIVRTVMSDLRTGTFKKARVFLRPQPSGNGSPQPSTDFLELDLTQTNTVYVLYSTDGKVKQSSSAPKYTNGDSVGDFFVKLDTTPQGSNAPMLTRVNISIETPAAAGVNFRNKYPAVTLMGDNR